MRVAHRLRSTPVAAVLVAVLVSSCASNDQPTADPATVPATTAHPENTGTAQVAPPAEMPTSAVGQQAQWVIDQLASDDGPTAAEAGERFSAGFLAEVPAEQVGDVFDELRPAGPWNPVDVDAADDDAVVQLHDGRREPWRMVISVDTDGAIAALSIQPDVDAAEPATSWAEIQERLTELDADVSLLAARVGDDGRCEPITELDSGASRPMASIFKLYVLGAVAEAVETGQVRWDALLTVTDDIRSLPSGNLQDEPNGTTVSVSRAAAGMIAISDNTAADLLVDLVGRDAVETAMTEMGHSDPAQPGPFITTREFFTLGWGPDDLRTRWRDASAEERQAILDELPPGSLTLRGRDVVGPAWEYGVDWFGSAEDICAAQVSLHDGDLDDPDTAMLRTILGHNRGVTIDEAQWPYVAYKGGSAPGVVTGSWYGERQDGERYVYVMQAAAGNAAALSDHSDFFGLAEDAFALLAAEP